MCVRIAHTVHTKYKCAHTHVCRVVVCKCPVLVTNKKKSRVTSCTNLRKNRKAARNAQAER